MENQFDQQNGQDLSSTDDGSGIRIIDVDDSPIEPVDTSFVTSPSPPSVLASQKTQIAAPRHTLVRKSREPAKIDDDSPPVPRLEKGNIAYPRKRYAKVIPLMDNRSHVAGSYFPIDEPKSTIEESMRSRFKSSARKFRGLFDMDYAIIGRSYELNWVMAIAGISTPTREKGIAIVPHAYAAAYLVARQYPNENIIVAVPEETSTYFFFCNNEPLYTSWLNQSIGNLPDVNFATAARMIIDQFKRAASPAVEVKRIVVVGSEVPMAYLNSEAIPAVATLEIVKEVDVAYYDGDLNLYNPSNKRMSFNRLYSSLPAATSSVTGFVLALMIGFSSALITLPVLRYISNGLHTYVSEVQSNISVLHAQQEKLTATLNQINANIAVLTSWKDSLANSKIYDWETIIRLFTSDPQTQMQSFSAQGNTATIAVNSTSNLTMDMYIRKLLLSGYFKSVTPPQRKPGTISYTFSLALQEQDNLATTPNPSATGTQTTPVLGGN